MINVPLSHKLHGSNINLTTPSGPPSKAGSMTNICHPKLIRDFINDAGVYPDSDEFNQLNKLDYNWYMTKYDRKVGSTYTLSESGNMNRYIFFR